MLANWKTFLLESGAVIQGGIVANFGSPASEEQATATGNIIVDLSSFSLIRAAGDDAAIFLQGQLTNDIRLVDQGRSQLSAYCHPNGRMLAIFRIFMHDNAYILRLPSTLQHGIIDRLRMYVLRSGVVLKPADAELQRIGIAGPDTGKILRDKIGSAPKVTGACIVHNKLTVIRVPGPQPRFEIVGPSDAARDLWNSIKADTVAVGTWAWSWLDIIAGIPNVHAETSAAFVPQMVNLELVGGVNFDKGCYTGQEVIARVHYLGKLKQRMYRAHVTADTIPRRGEVIYAPDSADQPRGTVVDAQPSPHGGYDMLAVIYSDSVESEELRLTGPHGPRLRIKDLPYALTTPT